MTYAYKGVGHMKYSHNGNGKHRTVIARTANVMDRTKQSQGLLRFARNDGIEQAVRERYARGAKAKEEALCCPTSYDPKYLKVIPKEILEKDYGCGDPSRYLKEGDVVLDLGSGVGKICYIASQVVGHKGRVIGVDFNPAMLSLARKHGGVENHTYSSSILFFSKKKPQEN